MLAGSQLRQPADAGVKVPLTKCWQLLPCADMHGIKTVAPSASLHSRFSARYPGAVMLPTSALGIPDGRTPANDMQRGLARPVHAALLGLPVLLPAIFCGEPQSAQMAMVLMAALAATGLLAFAAESLAQRGMLGGPARSRLPAVISLAAAAAIAPALGLGFAVVTAIIASLLFVRAIAVPLSAYAGLLLTTALGALVADAGNIALGSGRGIELVTLGGALALFGRLVDEGPVPPAEERLGLRRWLAPDDLLRDGALTTAVLLASVACVALLSGRGGTVGVLGLDGWLALLVFGCALAAAVLRGPQARGRLAEDPVVLVLGAAAALVMAVAAAPGSPLPSS